MKPINYPSTLYIYICVCMCVCVEWCYIDLNETWFMDELVAMGGSIDQLDKKQVNVLQSIDDSNHLIRNSAVNYDYRLRNLNVPPLPPTPGIIMIDTREDNMFMIYIPSWNSRLEEESIKSKHLEQLEINIHTFIEKYKEDKPIYLCGDVMMSYYWNPLPKWRENEIWKKRDIETLESYDLIVEDWKYIGDGRDRDVGSCQIFINLKNGKIYAAMEYEGCASNYWNDLRFGFDKLEQHFKNIEYYNTTHTKNKTKKEIKDIK